MAQVTPITMEPKYGALRALVNVLYIGAGIFALFALLSLSVISKENPITFAPLISCIVLAFNFVVMAQIISVFIDMEWNQRETNELLQQVIQNLPETAVKAEAEAE